MRLKGSIQQKWARFVSDHHNKYKLKNSYVDLLRFSSLSREDMLTRKKKWEKKCEGATGNSWEYTSHCRHFDSGEFWQCYDDNSRNKCAKNLHRLFIYSFYTAIFFLSLSLSLFWHSCGMDTSVKQNEIQSSCVKKKKEEHFARISIISMCQWMIKLKTRRQNTHALNIVLPFWFVYCTFQQWNSSIIRFLGCFFSTHNIKEAFLCLKDNIIKSNDS